MRPLLAKGLCYKVGVGDSMNVWEDPWIPTRLDYLPNSRNQHPVSVIMVNSLKLANGVWDEDKLEQLFNQQIVRNIKEIFWARNDRKDTIIWTKTKSVVFSVKSAYALEEDGNQIGTFGGSTYGIVICMKEQNCFCGN